MTGSSPSPFAQAPDCGRGGDLAAYLLGSLEPAEAERFETHLGSCELCAAAAGFLRPAVEVLPREVPAVAMPGGLRDRIMLQVRSEAELLSAAGAGADRVTGPSPRRRSHGRGQLLGGTLGGLLTRRFGAAAGALALACGIALGVVLAGGGSEPRGVTIHALVTGMPAGASATVVRTGSRAELVVAGLRQPPRGRIYQVWLAGADGTPRPTDALFSVSSTGSGRTDIPGDLRGVHQLMVTAEPLGGSRLPTRKPIIVASI